MEPPYGTIPSRRPDMDHFHLPIEATVTGSVLSGFGRTPRTARADDTPATYEALRKELQAMGPLLESPEDEAVEASCIETARNLSSLVESYETKFSRIMRASLQRTVAKSVAHSLARQLQSCRAHKHHRCPVNRVLFQLVRRLPGLVQPQDLPTQCLVSRVCLHAAKHLKEAQSNSPPDPTKNTATTSVAELVVPLDHDVRRVEAASRRQPLETPRMTHESMPEKNETKGSAPVTGSESGYEMGSGASGGELPLGWSREVSRSTGKEYFYNTVANLTQWERPTRSAYDEGTSSPTAIAAITGTPVAPRDGSAPYGQELNSPEPYVNAEASRHRRNSRNRARSELSNEIAMAEIRLLRQQQPSQPSQERSPEKYELEPTIEEGITDELDLMTWIQEALIQTIHGPIGIFLRNWKQQVFPPDETGP